jgi:SAM-dependent methyltransferase
MIRYFQSPVALEEHSIRTSIEHAARYARGVLLDIGCGRKPYASLFRGRIEHYVGIDIDLSSGKAVDICGDSLELPIRSSSIDTVLSNQSIEHVRSPERFMSEVARVLKPGGVAILTAPQLWCLHEEPNDYYRFTRYALEHLARKNDLDVIELLERFGAFAAIGQMFSLMLYLRQKDRKWRVRLIRPICASIQIFFRLLDKVWYDRALTLGYCLVVKRR